MAARVKLGTPEISSTSNGARYSEQWIGSKADIEAQYNIMVPGGFYTGKGTLLSRRKREDQNGGVWLMDVEYQIEYTDAGGEGNPATNTGPTSQRLTTARIPMQLETHPNYRMRWNHYLIGWGAQPIPSWWNTSNTPAMSEADARIYLWVKSLDDIPAESMKFAIVLKNPDMPGVDSYDKPVAQISEVGKHTSKTAAGWAVSVSLNRIFSEPILGDFGITSAVGGNWKFDDVEIYFDGKYWVARRVYTLSGDASGWNQELYGEVITP